MLYNHDGTCSLMLIEPTDQHEEELLHRTNQENTQVTVSSQYISKNVIKMIHEDSILFRVSILMSSAVRHRQMEPLAIRIVVT